MPAPPRWSPTHAHARAVGMAAACALLAILARRADVVVLAVPFVGAAAWGAHRRPSAAPRAELALAEATVFEGQVTTTITVDADGGATGDVVAVCLGADPAVGWRPRSAARADGVGRWAGERRPIATRAVRWGRHPISLSAAACTSTLGAFRTEGLSDGPVVLTTLPLSAEFDAADAMPRPAGLVGLHRANRQGGGSEPAEVRPFRAGDRLRRINWRVSSRTGELHVTSTWSDRDTHVLLLLDTEADIGRSEGVDGRASSLDIAVRAAAAIAEHFLRSGDRVGLIDLGRRVRSVPVGSGRRHLRRLLDALVVAEAAPNHRAEPVRLRPTEAGALVVVLSPLVGQAGQTQIAHLAHHGHTVVVVDTLPAAVGAPLTAVGRVGVPGADDGTGGRDRPPRRDRRARRRWHGRGTLDQVLRDVSRLATAPRGRR